MTEPPAQSGSQEHTHEAEGQNKNVPPHDSVHTETPDAQTISIETPTTLVALPITIAVTHPVDAPPLPRSSFPFGWSRGDLRRFLGMAFAAILALVFLWYVQAILPPFLIAFFLAALLDPTLREFERHGRSRVRAILTLYLAGLSILVVIGLLIVPVVITQVQELMTHLTEYTTDLNQTAQSFMNSHHALLNKLHIQETTTQDLINKYTGPINGAILGALGGIPLAFGGIASKALWLIIIPLSAFFFMRDYPMLRARIITQFPDQYHDRIDVMSREVIDVFSAYIRGLLKICSLYSVVAIILFSLLGLRYALFLGLFAGVFYAVPYVGQLFTAIGTGVVAYMMEDHNIFFFIHLHLPKHSLVYTLSVVILAVLVQNVFDQILYPRIVGGSVGLHPVVSIFSLMAGATLFGIWGMLIAVPVAASIQIMLLYFFPKLTRIPAPYLLETPAPLA